MKFLTKGSVLSLAVLVVLAFGLALYISTANAAKPTAAGTNMIVGRPAKGMYCADPANWIKNGYKIYVWGDATPVKAQAYDVNGYLITPGTGITWKVTATGETGSMSIVDSTNKVFSATPKSMGALVIGDKNYEITYTADGKTFKGVVRRWNSDCDSCHSTPPAHARANAGSNGTSNCRNCHDLAEKMKVSHASRISNNTTSDACYKCHPSPCYSGVHAGKFPNDSMGCVTCHGSLADAVNAKMKISAQLGLPRCENCHTGGNPVPYAQNAGKEYKSSVGHGRASKGAKNLCIVCHNSMHMEEKPTGWGDGIYNNCSKCHTVQPTANNMGLDCGKCHVSSWDPHMVKK